MTPQTLRRQSCTDFRTQSSSSHRFWLMSCSTPLNSTGLFYWWLKCHIGVHQMAVAYSCTEDCVGAVLWILIKYYCSFVGNGSSLLSFFWIEKNYISKALVISLERLHFLNCLFKHSRTDISYWCCRWKICNTNNWRARKIQFDLMRNFSSALSRSSRGVIFEVGNSWEFSRNLSS